MVTVLGQQAELSPLEGIHVEMKKISQDSHSLTTLADSAGHYEFTQLPLGTYTLGVNQPGFKPFTEACDISMGIHFGRFAKLVAISLVLGVTSAASIAQGQSYARQPAEVGARLTESAPVGLTSDEIVAKMLERNRLRNEQLRRYSAVRTYEIRNLEGKLAAQAVVRVDYEAPDKKTFNKTSEKGSGIVRHLVFDRLIQSEGETSAGREHHDSAITAANYTFVLIGEEEVGGYHCFVLEATPKRKDKYLFEGKIWIETEDFAVAKIAGHPAKKPSFWVNHADFVRRYQRIDRFWFPYRDETSVEVKMYGRRVFTVDHQQYVINPANPLQAKTGGMGHQD